jgi:two-component system, NarL family, nitrate/nitrite response regulator NarL
MMRLVLCDDHRILVEALAVALQARGHDVQATTTREECIAAVAENQPDVCLLDLYLPGREDGLQAAQVLRTRYPDTRILILSGVADPLIFSRAIDLGVVGMVRKDQTVDKIEAALQQVVAGESVFQTDLIRDVVRHLAAKPAKDQPLQYLTAREAEVLRRIVAGESTKEMARSMHIAASTVRTYVQNVLTKLGAHSRLEASAIAVRAQLVDGIPEETWSPP